MAKILNIEELNDGRRLVEMEDCFYVCRAGGKKKTRVNNRDLQSVTIYDDRDTGYAVVSLTIKSGWLDIGIDVPRDLVKVRNIIDRAFKRKRGVA